MIRPLSNCIALLNGEKVCEGNISVSAASETEHF